ncbi:hypothetical protein LX32DRAFT_332616 [Colletotrichum zoysiae]|uniref:Uncharacterized protein n=1 Tax=Colletotrichum zoysiae TaxID=1216348 RepID=A0AAD9HLH1_9PEZI|nr:hypothetical protein LX32DRAFT_332616 [Colletotrichum zoysiae]
MRASLLRCTILRTANGGREPPPHPDGPFIQPGDRKGNFPTWWLRSDLRLKAISRRPRQGGGGAAGLEPKRALSLSLSVPNQPESM